MGYYDFENHSWSPREVCGQLQIEESNEWIEDAEKNQLYDERIEGDRSYQEVLAKIDNETLNTNNATACFNLGVDRSQLGDTQGAIAAWTQALSIDPSNAHSYYYRGVARAEQKDYTGAIEDFDQVISLNPNYVNAYIKRGEVYYSLGDRQGAIKDYHKVLCLKPTDAIAYCNQGKVRLNLREYQEAIEDFTQALRLNPYLAEAYYYRSLSQDNLGNLQQAIEDLQKAAELFHVSENIAKSHNALDIARKYQVDQVQELARMTPYELGESNKEEAIDCLIQYLLRGSKNEKILAASAIRKLARDFKETCNLAVPYLLTNLSEKGVQVRQYTLKALDVLALPKSAAQIIESVAENDEAEYNRKIAVAVLRKIK